MKPNTFEYINKENIMKYQKSILIILFLLFVSTSCARQQPKSPGEISISWSELIQGVGLEVGDILEVVLPANPSTGYAWEIGFYNPYVLKPYGESEFSSSNANLGLEGSQIMHLEAIDAGETELVFVYQRSFEDAGVDQKTFKFNVVVK
jgi:predicted secreted protein